jgi:hypothetical protein
MAATPNFFRQEFMLMDVPWRDTVIDKRCGEDGFSSHRCARARI